MQEETYRALAGRKAVNLRVQGRGESEGQGDARPFGGEPADGADGVELAVKPSSLLLGLTSAGRQDALLLLKVGGVVPGRDEGAHVERCLGERREVLRDCETGSDGRARQLLRPDEAELSGSAWGGQTRGGRDVRPSDRVQRKQPGRVGYHVELVLVLVLAGVRARGGGGGGGRARAFATERWPAGRHGADGVTDGAGACIGT